MSRHGVQMMNSDGVGYYDHLNKDPLEITIGMDELAKLVVDQNYGSVRFLAAMVRVRRQKHLERIAEYERRGDHDVARAVQEEGDELAEGLVQLLQTGAF